MLSQTQANTFAIFALCSLAIILPLPNASAESTAAVAIPPYQDKYSTLVKQLEAGETDIDYAAFRESLLDSKQFQMIGEQRSTLDALRKTMHQLMKASKYSEIVATAKKILGIDYTDMEAHKILHQTYQILGDNSNRDKYHAIEFGLLNSIVKNGDGKTCATGWPVIQVTEEYFILAMIGAKLSQQSIDNTGGLCDRMEVETEEGKKVYYFEISRVFKGYNKQGIR
jgi:Domain of unknown function (DUF4919)